MPWHYGEYRTVYVLTERLTKTCTRRRCDPCELPSCFSILPRLYLAYLIAILGDSLTLSFGRLTRMLSGVAVSETAEVVCISQVFIAQTKCLRKAT